MAQGDGAGEAVRAQQGLQQEVAVCGGYQPVRDLGLDIDDPAVMFQPPPSFGGGCYVGHWGVVLLFF